LQNLAAKYHYIQTGKSRCPHREATVW